MSIFVCSLVWPLWFAKTVNLTLWIPWICKLGLVFFSTALVGQQGGNPNSATDPKRSHRFFPQFVDPKKNPGRKVFPKNTEKIVHFSSCEGILLVPWSTWQLSPQSIRSSSLMPWYHWPPFSPMQPSSLLDSRHPKIRNFQGFKKSAGHLKLTNQMKLLDTINHQWKQILNRYILLITLNVKLLGPCQLVFSWENWIIYKVYINIHIIYVSTHLFKIEECFPF